MKEKKLLLHICCAPDATVPWPELISEGFETVGFFYGGNIHPADEYEKRADAVRTLSREVGMPAVLPKYEPDKWLEATYAYKDEPERGRRCELCFALQLEDAAEYAANHGFTHLSTTLTISPHKDPVLINSIGEGAAKKQGLVWVEKIWRRNDGFKRSVDESRRLGLYRQNYCGCVYSIRNEQGDNDERK
ncbi:MAG: epoxyqueuosine reductase QueH [Synergistaceae bacterium]|nr:epoxyqueuosine reductase QueH [Synergistaceae bacterium]